MQEVQIFILLPEGKRAHCKFGYLFVFLVGLYLPRRRFLLAAATVPLLQIGHLIIKIKNASDLSLFMLT